MRWRDQGMSKPSKEKKQAGLPAEYSEGTLHFKTGPGWKACLKVKEIFIPLKVFGLVTTIFMRSTRKYLTNWIRNVRNAETPTNWSTPADICIKASATAMVHTTLHLMKTMPLSVRGLMCKRQRKCGSRNWSIWRWMFLNPKNKTANSDAKGVKNGNGKIELLDIIFEFNCIIND